jgi:hypothetical protein
MLLHETCVRNLNYFSTAVALIAVVVSDSAVELEQISCCTTAV